MASNEDSPAQSRIKAVPQRSEPSTNSVYNDHHSTHNPPPDPRLPASDLEQILPIRQTQDVLIEYQSEPSDHPAEFAQVLAAAAEAGRAAYWNIERTRSSSSSSSTADMPDPGWVKERLEQHDMVQDDGSELDKFPNFKKAITKIISRDRRSTVTEEHFQKFKGKLTRYQDQNEDTLLAMVLPAIIGEDRTICVNENLPEEELWETVEFFDSGIITIVNREFEKGYVPYRNGAHVIDHELVAKMTKLKDEAMTNPKPDRAYGTVRDKFNMPKNFQMPHEIRDYLEILQDLHLPFLIVEGKSQGGMAGEARNQANRGGASLVNGHRLCRATLGFEDPVGADHETFVFSATYNDGLLEIWVHWAQVCAGENATPIYHMSLVASKSLREATTFRQARMILHNIMDWGCGKRFDGLTPMYQAIIKYAEKKQKEAEAHKFGPKKQGEGSNDKSPEHEKLKTDHS
ncbi:MAG: hypothetical protein Q9216_001906 [Gyalolechia sp. 2 TL-2023]